MESTYLKTFVEVVECGSFTRAAEVLFITQSAVSRRVKFLEEQYGTTLLDRSGPVLQPTEAGRVVYEKARGVLALEDELTRELRKTNGHVPFHFACTRPFGITHLPRIMNAFLSKYEGKVDVRLSLEMPSSALQGLREKRHDAIVIEHWEKFDFDPFKVVRLGLDEMIFVSSPRLDIPAPWACVDQLLSRRLYRRREDCCSAKLLAFNMAAIGRDAGEFANILAYDDLHVIIESVLAGEGIAFISKSIVAGHIEAGTLREHRVEGFTHARKRSLVYRREVSDSQLFRYFFTCVTEAFGTSMHVTTP